MSLTEYKVTRPADEAEFTMRLNDEDYKAYKDRGWSPTRTKRTVDTGRDLGARSRTGRRPAKANEAPPADDAETTD